MEADDTPSGMPPLPTMETVSHMPPGMPPLPKPNRRHGPYIPIGGWLLWIIIGRVVGCGIALDIVATSPSLREISFRLLFVSAAVMLLYALLMPTRRTMDLVRYSLIFEIVLSVLFIVDDPARAAKGVGGAVVWGLYFMRSERVKRTYGENLTIFGSGQAAIKEVGNG